MKYSPYSFSRLGCHDGCNRQFKYKYIDKIPEGPRDMTALLKGGAVHSILEYYPKTTTHKLAPKYQHIADKFVTSRLGAKYLTKESTRELRFGLDENLEPCGYSYKKAIFRGSIDFVAPVNDLLHLIDWKTGKLKDIRWQNFNQLMFYAIYFFKRYPSINHIKISYVYIEHDTENDVLLERQYLQNYIDQLMELIHCTENDTEFKKNPTKLCDWCPYQLHCESDIECSV
jgi:CRISPR/Cas system-associated exonuclease Cas4 (RecB family)